MLRSMRVLIRKILRTRHAFRPIRRNVTPPTGAPMQPFVQNPGFVLETIPPKVTPKYSPLSHQC
jgi:hypothetical protein